MTKARFLGASALAGSLLIGLPAFAADTTDAAAAAQAAPAEVTEDSAADTGAEVTVTGSRIRRPNETSAVPTATLGGAEFFETGSVQIAETLNELPQLRSTLGPQQSAVTGLGNSGLNLLDLRGLGFVRTLVLVNGRRHVAGDIGLNAASVDINTIPTGLIDRVDVVTGGNSAIYGSDAIAGVVNFVMKRSFEGLEARAQAGISEYDDAGAYFGSLTYGKNFAGGRGNIAASIEYGRQDRYFASARPHLLSQDGFVTTDTDTLAAGSLNNADGVPDTTFFRNLKSATTGNQGIVVFNFSPTAAANCGTDVLGNFFNCPYKFQADGTLVPVTGARVGLGPNGSFVGGNGDSFREDDQFELSPQVDRIVANVVGRYEFSPAAELFTELKYARIKAVGSGNTGPGFIISAGNSGDTRQLFRLDNPYLTGQASTLIRNMLLTSGRSTGTVANAGGALSAADIAAIGAGTYRVRLQESFLNLGKREQRVTRETYRAVLGLRGTFNTDWTYETSVNYGQYTERDERDGNLNRQRLLLALDAGRASATSPITCRAAFDPAARTGLSSAGLALPAAERAAILAADIAACVPINPFGGQFTQDQINYVTNPTWSDGKITQLVVNGFMSGDLSQLFELPGGPVGFAVGAEYRRETNYFELDPLSRNGYTVFNALATFPKKAMEVREVFGELRVPLLSETPFFHELTASGAIRYADYSGATGGALAWNAGAEWAPIPDIRFRGNYSRAVRAPLLSETFAAPSATFIALPLTDPCALRSRGNGTSFRAANCAASGVPAAYDYQYVSTPVGVSTGNPNLTEETSDSWTVGAVVQPRWVPGLSLSVDYYDIKVNDIISAVSGQTALNQCVDLPTITGNPFCTLFQRNTTGAALPTGEEPGRPIEGSFLVTALNFAARKARGIDFEAGYRRNIGGLGTLDLRATWTHVLQRSNFESPVDPTFENVLLRELGDPKDEVLFRANLSDEQVNITYNLRYIGKQYIGTYEGYNVTNGQPMNNDQFVNPFTPSIYYHNVRVGFNIMKKHEFYIGVDNLTNVKPPYGFNGIGAGPAGVGTQGIFDNRGRFFYSGFRARF